MFAPHHQAAADELVRVCRPGRHDRADQLDARGLHRPAVRDDEAVRAAAAARRAAAAAVGRARTTSAALLGDRVTDVSVRRPTVGDRPVRPGRRTSATTSRRVYGPTIATYRFIADDPERVAALDQALADLGRPVRPGRRRHGVGVPAVHRAQARLTGFTRAAHRRGRVGAARRTRCPLGRRARRTLAPGLPDVRTGRAETEQSLDLGLRVTVGGNQVGVVRGSCRA